jgi:glycosyltransferase involved in cell wall biosynthesis
MKNVLFVVPSANPGGSQKALASLIRCLPDLGINPIVALLENGPAAAWFDRIDSTVVRIAGGRVRQLRRTAATIGTLANLARVTSAVAIVSNESKGHIWGGLAALRAGVPALWWQHGIPRGGVIEQVAARVPVAAVVCGSDLCREAQLRMNRSLVVEKVYPGIALDEVVAQRGSGSRIRRELGWTDRPVVGIVGRLQPWKGQDIFLRTAALLAADHPDIRFAVIGGAVLGSEGPYPENLHRLSRDLGISARVHFAGHQADVYPWIDALDVVVHASRGEPFGLVLVEAMALGKPIVATALGGPTEILEHRRTGLLVRPGDPAEIARAVRTLLEDPVFARKLGSHAANRAMSFSEERMAIGFSRILGGVVSEPADGHLRGRVMQ